MDLAVRITVHLLLVPGLRMTGAIPLLPLCAFIVPSEKRNDLFYDAELLSLN
jgi:hypothetical protein